MTARKTFALLSILALFLLSACDETTGVIDSLGPDPYEVDIAFREFYQMLGGRDTLGPPISPPFVYGEVKYQYTVAGLMVLDPAAPGNQRFQLAALGLDMGVREAQVPRPEQEGVRYVDGHIIWEFFVPTYERLGGARYVGKPLTELHFNPDKRRYEQHFENLGIYWLEGAAPEDVHLLAYGAWKCDANCRKPHLGNSLVILPYQVDDHFAGTVERLGADFTGFALSDSYNTPDGYLEQVYENVVLVSSPKKPRRIFLRNISDRLGIRPDPLVEPNNLPGFSFYKVQEERGYNVPQKFLDYLAFHGGLEASGSPISEMIGVKDNVYRQCFINLCLEETIFPSGMTMIRPAQLGYTYRQLAVITVETPKPQIEAPQAPREQVEQEAPQDKVQHTQPEGSAQPAQELETSTVPQPVEPLPAVPSAPELGLQVWEIYAMVSPNQSQEIGVSVFENNTPLANIEPDIIVVLPDETTRIYYMQPTGSDGQTRLQLDPIDAPNGTIIPYQVCIYNLNGSKFCVKDSFLIWSNP